MSTFPKFQSPCQLLLNVFWNVLHSSFVHLQAADSTFLSSQERQALSPEEGPVQHKSRPCCDPRASLTDRRHIPSNCWNEWQSKFISDEVSDNFNSKIEIDQMWCYAENITMQLRSKAFFRWMALESPSPHAMSSYCDEMIELLPVSSRIHSPKAAPSNLNWNDIISDRGYNCSQVANPNTLFHILQGAFVPTLSLK